MNWRRLAKQVALAPIMEVRVRWRRYVISTAIIFLAHPLLRAVDWYLRGAFVGNVQYMGMLLNYALFASVGLVMDTLLVSLLFAVREVLTARKPLLVIVTEHPLTVPIALALQVTLTNFPYSLALAAFLAVFVGVSFLAVVLAYVLTFLAGAFLTIGLAILFAIVGLYVRGRDYRHLIRATSRVLWVFIPTVYGLSAYPAGIRGVVAYVPTVALVEGVRRFVFGMGGWDLMSYAFFSGVLLMVFSYALYRRAFNAARRTGRIVLE